jgi:hypothetical protein
MQRRSTATAVKAQPQGQLFPEHGIYCRCTRTFDAFECSPKGTPRCRCTCGGPGRQHWVRENNVLHALEQLRAAWGAYCGALEPTWGIDFHPLGARFNGFLTSGRGSASTVVVVDARGNGPRQRQRQRQSLKASPSQNMGFAIVLDVLLMPLNDALKARTVVDACATEPAMTGAPALRA